MDLRNDGNVNESPWHCCHFGSTKIEKLRKASSRFSEADFLQWNAHLLAKYDACLRTDYVIHVAWVCNIFRDRLKVLRIFVPLYHPPFRNPKCLQNVGNALELLSIFCECDCLSIVFSHKFTRADDRSQTTEKRFLYHISLGIRFSRNIEMIVLLSYTKCLRSIRFWRIVVGDS